eukprot:c23127_g1_i1 orf=294-1541(+)
MRHWMVSTWEVLLLVLVCIRGVLCCSKSLTINGSVHTFVNCVDLQVQGASIAWTLVLSNSSNSSSSSSQDYNVLDLAFSGSATATEGWVGWGLNPDRPQMVGSSTFLAYNAANGSNLLPYRLTTATLGGTPLACSPIDYTVAASAVQISGVAMSMLLTLHLNASLPLTLNHVWNRGPSVSQFHPAPHSTQANDLKAFTQIDMSTGVALSTNPASSIQILKSRHALINLIAWGFLLPMGVISARYLKPFADPMWFYIHIGLQCVGYALGVSGWVTGLQLEKASHGVFFPTHRNIGMVLFSLATLQVMALLVRPSKEHTLRRYWKVYHHSMGYMVIILGIVNVFIGLSILGGSQWPRHSLICVLVALGAIALLLECITWFAIVHRQRQERIIGATILAHKQQSNGAFGPTEHILRVL